MLTGGHHRSRGRTLSCILFFISILPACSPRIIEKVRTEYVTQTVQHRDTIITKDSIYIKEWMKGDTVYVREFRDRFVYRDRWRDSIQLKEVHDTTAVEVKVEKELTWAQKAKINSFPWLLIAILCLGGWLYLRRR